MRLIVAVLAIALLGSLYGLFNATRMLAAEQMAVARSQKQVLDLKKNVEERDAQIQDLQAKLNASSQQIQGLAQKAEQQTNGLRNLEADLLAQRLRVQQKQKEFQDLISSPKGTDPATSQRITFLNDDIKLLEQRLKAIGQDLSNTSYDASDARASTKNNAAWRMAQINDQIKSSEAGINQLKAQRAALSPQDKRGGASQNINAQIAAANQNLQSLKLTAAQTKSAQQNDSRALESQIHSSTDELKREQSTDNKKLTDDKNELYRLQQNKAATGNFQKERDALLKKLEAELQDETTKLQGLETQVRLQKAQNSMPVGH